MIAVKNDSRNSVWISSCFRLWRTLLQVASHTIRARLRTIAEQSVNIPVPSNKKDIAEVLLLVEQTVAFLVSQVKDDAEQIGHEPVPQIHG